MIQFLKDKLGISEAHEAIGKLQAQVQAQKEYLMAWNAVALPATFEPEAKLMQKVQRALNEEFGLQSWPTVVHRNDMMFAFHLHHHAPDAYQALYTYFKVGARIAHGLPQVLPNAPGLKKILDFGSGYGRVSRFLTQFFPEAEIEVSELKESSVQFQTENLGFSGFSHGYRPEGFDCDKKDLIIAVSVFSHLPQDLFKAWMSCLVAKLNPGGRLFFTYHGSEESEPAYHYREESEDLLLAHTDDYLQDGSSYGVSHISEAWLQKFFEAQNWSYQLLEHRITPLQRSALVFKGD